MKKNCYKSIQKPIQRNVLFLLLLFLGYNGNLFYIMEKFNIIKGNYISEKKTNTFNSRFYII